MDNDTDLGGPAVVFPITRCTLIRASESPDPAVRRQAQATLISAYWKPVYKYIRVKWQLPNEDAKDLTQGFFFQAVKKSFLERFDPGKARFRTFVRTCVDRFVANERRAAGRLKRGGRTELSSLDFEGADGELCRQPPAPGIELDDYFHQEWVRELFSLAVEELRRQCAATEKNTHFALFELYDLEGPLALAGLTYSQLGAQFGLSATQVTNHLAWARRQFRQLLLDRLRASTGSEEEYQQEVMRLFGRDRQ